VSEFIDPEDERDMALLLVRLGDQDRGRVDPSRILARPAGCASRESFMFALDEGWLDGEGWVTKAGREALREWEAA
jgi:hypothetical protein